MRPKTIKRTAAIRLHWVLDAVLGEDRDRARVGAAPHALHLVRVATLMLQRAAGHTSAMAAKTRFAVRPKLAVECVAMRVARASRPSTGKATATSPRDGGVAWGRRALRTPGAPGGFAAPSR